MTIDTTTTLDDVSSLAATIRRLQARNIVLEAENERLKASLKAREEKAPDLLGLTPMQGKLLDFIDRYQRQHRGVSPSFAEMTRGVGLASKAGVHRLLTGLEQRGAIVRGHNQHRAIRIVQRHPTEVPKASASTDGVASSG